jgi:hypothetical protein
VNIHDWHRHGLKPPFATVEQWIQDQLGYLEAEDEACYAVSLREEPDRRGPAVRILIASDQGLFDMLWERPEKVDGRHLTSRHYPWADVRGVRLSGTTRLDSDTLMRSEPKWRLEIAEPEVDFEADESAALLEFWTQCMEETQKARGG